MTDAPVSDSARSEAEALARRLYQALATGDRETLTELLHERFVGQTTQGLPLGLGGVQQGPRAMRHVWGEISRAYDVRAEPDAFALLDDGRLLVHGRYIGVGRASGAPLDAAFVHLLAFADGSIIGLEQITDSQRWNEALDGTSATLSVIQFAVEDGLACIRLNRPAANNAIDAQMARELREVATRCAERPDIRAILICASGPRFTTGGDIAYFASQPHEQLPDTLRRMIDDYHLALVRFTELDAPIVCAVRGAAAGGGLGLLYCSDIVIASESARFALGYGGIGLAADGGNSWFLPRLVGPRRAAELFLQAKQLTGVEAAEWGLITQSVADEQVEETALTIARRLAQGPTRAFGAMRRLLRETWTTSLSEQLAAERDSMAAAAATDDAAEGIAAFAARRAPQFQGH